MSKVLFSEYSGNHQPQNFVDTFTPVSILTYRARGWWRGSGAWCWWRGWCGPRPAGSCAPGPRRCPHRSPGPRLQHGHVKNTEKCALYRKDCERFPARWSLFINEAQLHYHWSYHGARRPAAAGAVSLLHSLPGRADRRGRLWWAWAAWAAWARCTARTRGGGIMEMMRGRPDTAPGCWASCPVRTRANASHNLLLMSISKCNILLNSLTRCIAQVAGLLRSSIGKNI